MKISFGKLSLILVVALAISMFFGLPNYLRYQIEKRFGEPHTFFYGTNLGVMADDFNEYLEELSLDDYTEPMDFEVSKVTGNTEVYLYGRFVNSADPLVVILNDNVVYNGHPSSEISDFWGRFYIEKYYVVKLDDFIKTGTNKIIISTGNEKQQYVINSR